MNIALSVQLGKISRSFSVCLGAPQLLGRPSNTLSGLTVCLPRGPFNGHVSKRRAITVNGVRLHLHCEGNDHVLTIGFFRGKHRVGKKQETGGKKGLSSMHSDHNVFMKPPDNTGSGENS